LPRIGEAITRGGRTPRAYLLFHGTTKDRPTARAGRRPGSILERVSSFTPADFRPIHFVLIVLQETFAPNGR
jgi:hypothetical protein